MALQLSTGLRDKMLNNTGFKTIFTDGVIYISTGPQPTNADTAMQGNLLGMVTLNGGAFAFGSPTNGLEFAVPVGGVITKAVAEVWTIIASATGTAGWFRLMGNAMDSLGASTTLPRLDGSVAQSGGDLNLSSIQLVAGGPTTIDVFQFTLPPSDS